MEEFSKPLENTFKVLNYEEVLKCNLLRATVFASFFQLSEGQKSQRSLKGQQTRKKNKEAPGEIVMLSHSSKISGAKENIAEVCNLKVRMLFRKICFEKLHVQCILRAARGCISVFH